MYIVLMLKTMFLYLFILFVYRIMKKKELNQFNIIDFIVSILIAELGVFLIINKSNDILMSAIPIISLVCMQMLIRHITLKNYKIGNIINGKPIIIIKNGKLNFTEMSKLKYSLDDLLSNLRIQGIKSIDKVKYAVLENNGNLSIFNDNSDYPLPLILDGTIDYEVLKEINKDYGWIINVLKKKNITLEEVYYGFYVGGKTFIIKKSELF